MCSDDWEQSGLVMSLVFGVETVGKKKSKGRKQGGGHDFSDE